MNAHEASILIVDDEQANVDLLHRILESAGYSRVTGTTDPRAALSMTAEADLLLLDLHMPLVDGFSVLRGLSDPTLPVLVLTADVTDGAKHRALGSGATDFVTKPFDVTEVLLRIRNLLTSRMLTQDFAMRAQTLAGEVRRGEQAVQAAHVETAHRLSIAAEARDDETGGHIERVGAMSGRLASVLELPAPDVEIIGTAARLHDIGKIGVPDAVLLKPGTLTKEEFEVMRSHTVIGREILARSDSPVLRAAADVAMTHHERWDGGGYPHGLAREEIPLAGRIAMVADAFDAMTNDRRYRKARPVDEAVAEILSERGRQFDPDVARVLPEALRS